MTPPANDNFSSAATITGASGTATVDNTDATLETGEPTLGGLVTCSVWYNWTAPSSGIFSFATYGPDNWDRTLGVFTGSAVNALTEVVSAIPTGHGNAALLLQATSGVTYRIQVGTQIDLTGSLSLTWAKITPLSLPWSWPLVNPQAFYYHDFGASYNSRADWVASFRYTSISAPPPPPLFATLDYFERTSGSPEVGLSGITWDTDLKFDCRATIENTDGYALLGADASDAYGHTVSLERNYQLAFYYPDTVFDGVNGFLYGYSAGGVQYEFAWDSLATPGEQFTIDFFGVTKYYSEIPPAFQKRWFCVTTLQEMANPDDPSDYGRARLWIDGALIIDTAVDAPTTAVGACDTWYEDFGTSYKSNEALFQFLYGGTLAVPIDPIEGLEGITDSNVPTFDYTAPCQWGGVTAFTHDISRGTIRTTVELGGQPKGGYKRHRALGQTTPPKLPAGPIPDGPLIGMTNRRVSGEAVIVAAAPYTDTTLVIPAGVIIQSVSVRVVVAIPGPTTDFDVGDTSLANRFNTAPVSTAVDSIDPGTKANGFNATATPVRLTMNGGSPSSATGHVRVTVTYYEVTF